MYMHVTWLNGFSIEILGARIQPQRSYARGRVYNHVMQSMSNIQLSSCQAKREFLQAVDVFIHRNHLAYPSAKPITLRSLRPSHIIFSSQTLNACMGAPAYHVRFAHYVLLRVAS